MNIELDKSSSEWGFLYFFFTYDFRKVWCLGVLKKVGWDKDEIKRWWVLGKEKSQTHGHKNYHSLYHWCYDFLLDWSQKQEDVTWYYGTDEVKIDCLTNCSPSPVGERVHIFLNPIDYEARQPVNQCGFKSYQF